MAYLQDAKTPSPIQKRRRLLGSTTTPDILLVEDVPVSKKVVTLSLIKAHYTVDIASSGEEALQKISNQHNYKLCLMDIGLPGISGVEASKEIRKMEQERGLPPLVIFGLTGAVSPEELRVYEAAGMDGCIMKGAIVAQAVDKAFKLHAERPGVFINLTDDGGEAHAPRIQPTTSAHSRRRSLGQLPLAPLSPAHSESEEDAAMTADPDQDVVMQSRDMPQSPAHGPEDPTLLTARARLGLGISAKHVSRLRPSLTTGSFEGGHGPSNLAQVLSPVRVLSSRSFAEVPLSAHHRLTVTSPSSPDSPSSDASVSSLGSFPSPQSAASPLSARSPSSRSLSRSTSQSQFVDYDCLLVEDVRVSQRVAQAVLTRAGFKVDVAADGETAVDKVINSGNTYRIILMDIGLPGMTGIEACMKIRAFERMNNRPPCIIFGLTGNTEETNLHTYAESGMDGCISKGGNLVEALHEALDKHSKHLGTFVDPGSKARRDRAQPFKRTAGPSRAAVEAANQILMRSDDIIPSAIAEHSAPTGSATENQMRSAGA